MQLLVQHQDALLRFILPMVGNHSDAQDVLQDTATAMWKKFGNYDDAMPFFPWARQFARNEVLHFHRRSRKHAFLSEELLQTLLTESQDEEAIYEERKQALRECLLKLPESDRKLIQVRYAEQNQSIEELSRGTSFSANAFYKSLGRIRRVLMSCINRKVATHS
ncbi:sigma-70 family RNA polymerase sigma factor [Bremerella sp. T1]|uniref:sigma-70 family RNA polymerase sigma factor n=1 Tax=Bremerella sp. TYQ1 TaxID=3119568 RepID=UPI001CCF3E29|nr:sigma-70 family RNA polymerase sigma factor [Bremerella volcania]UBM36727.1 sigma-70 family RNA polymerase sigma factor [Bremerella volcania]